VNFWTNSPGKRGLFAFCFEKGDTTGDISSIAIRATSVFLKFTTIIDFKLVYVQWSVAAF